MLSIPILQGILREHGKEEFIKRINKMLNTNFKLDENAQITTTKDSIIVGNRNPITITRDEELYKITTQYKKYKTIKFYYNGELLRNLVIFPTEDGDYLALDSLDNGNFKTTRITKTKEDDKYFNKGYYEREITTFPIIPIDIKSHYFNNEETEDEERIIDLAGLSNYYHHYIGKTNGNYFQESSMCQDTPYLTVSGHLRVLDDLLHNSFERKRANIIIRGINTDENDNSLGFYQSIFEFTKEGFVIIDTTVDSQDNDIDTNRILARTDQTRFSSELINELIVLITERNIINPSHLDNILTELNRIKDILLEKEHKKLHDPQPIELMMHVITDSNRLALNIYDNLPRYEELIKNELNPSKPKALK